MSANGETGGNGKQPKNFGTQAAPPHQEHSSATSRTLAAKTPILRRQAEKRFRQNLSTSKTAIINIRIRLFI